MQIDIPSEFEPYLEQRAADAGFESVGEYVLGLVQANDPDRGTIEKIAADPRIESLALEGIASGPAMPLDIEEIRKEVHQRLAADSP